MRNSLIKRLWICSWVIASCFATSVAEPQARSYKQVSIPINILDVELRRVIGINGGDISVRLDGEPLTVKLLKDNGVPRHIVLVLDVSGSMIPGRRDLASWVASNFIPFIPNASSLAMMAFSSRIIEEIGFDKDRRLMLDRLSDLSLDSKDHNAPSRIFDAVQRAADLIYPVQPGDTIFLLSDGREARSKVTDTRLRDMLIQKQIRLFMFRPGYDPGERLGENAQFLEKLCLDSGGMRFVFYPNSDPWRNTQAYTLTAHEKQILLTQLIGFFGAILTFYQLDLEIPFNVKKNAKLSLEFLNRQAKQTGFSVLYSKTIPAN